MTDTVKVPDYWEKHAKHYVNGWEFAENDWESFDSNFFADHLELGVEREAYQAGYYAYWETQGVK